jgi:hypothetical protein
MGCDGAMIRAIKIDLGGFWWYEVHSFEPRAGTEGVYFVIA